MTNPYDAILAPLGAPAETPYDAVLDEMLRAGEVALKRSFAGATTTTPDAHAQVLDLAQRTKLPPGVVARHRALVERQAARQATPYDRLLTEHPTLAGWLADPNHAAVARDDLDRLSRLDRLVVALERGALRLPQAGRAIQLDVNARILRDLDVVDRRLAAGEAPEAIPEAEDVFGHRWRTPEERAALRAELTQHIGTAATRIAARQTQIEALPQDPDLARFAAAPTFADKWAVFAERPVDFILRWGAESAPLMVPGIAGAAVAGPVGGAPAAAAAFGVGSAQVEYAATILQSFADEGIDVRDPAAVEAAVADRALMARIGQRAFTRAMAVGAFDVASGGVAGRTLAPARLAARPVLRQVVNQPAQAVAQGALGAAGEAAATLTTGEAPDVGELMAEFFGEFATAPIEVGTMTAARARQRLRDRLAAKERQALFEALAAGAATSKTGQRLPDALQDLVGRLTADGPIESVYVDPEVWQSTYEQAGLDPRQAAADATGDPAAYDQALAAGHALRIPTARYATTIAPTPQHAALGPDLRLGSPEALTAREADALAEEAQRAATAADVVEDTPGDPAAAVREDVLGQLLATGFERGTAEAYAALYASTFRALGQRVGLDPFVLYQRYGLRVERPLPAVLQRPDAVETLDALLDRLRAGDVPSERAVRGPSLLEALRERGLKGDVGEVRDLDLDAARKPFQRKLVRDDGLTLDQAAEFAAERGYLAERDIEALLAAIREEVAGRPTYARGQENPTLLAQRQQLEELDAYLQSLGLRVDRLENAEIKARLLAQSAPGRPATPTGTTFEQAAFHGGAAADRLSTAFVGTGLGARAGGWGLYASSSKAKADLYRQRRRQRGEPGRLFTLEVPEDDAFLHWDRPLDEQPEPVRDALADDPTFRALAGTSALGAAYYRALAERLGSDESASRYLAERGLAGNRIEQDGEATFVLFDDDLIEIVAFEQRQPGEAAPRGAIAFGPDRQFTIRLLEQADLSTFLHETGHFYLEVLGDLAQAADAPEALRADYQTLLDWFGVETRDQVTTAHHEQFARGFEAYLMEGKAPSPALRSVFAKFRAWLVAIYRTLTGLQVRLTPEVRRVLDRLVATEEAIAAAEAEAEVGPLFTTAAEAGMTEAEFDAYRATVARAAERARETVQQRLLADLQREQAAWWQTQREAVRAEVAADVYQDRVYIALSILQKGTMPDGSPLPEGATAVTLDQAAVEAAYGKASTKRVDGVRQGSTITNRLLDLKVYRKAGGVTPDVAAELLGFPSGDALVTALVNARPREALIDAETDVRMRERYGDLLTDGSLAEVARTAVESTHRADVLLAELRALVRAQAQRGRAATRRAETAEAATAREQREREVERRWADAERKLAVAIERGVANEEIRRLRTEVQTVRAEAETALSREQRERAYERRWLEAEQTLAVAIERGAREEEIRQLREEVRRTRAEGEAAIRQLRAETQAQRRAERQADAAAARAGRRLLTAGVPDLATVRRLARERIAGLAVRDLHPQTYLVAARRASRDAVEAVARGDYARAAKRKGQELLNLELYRAAEAAKAEVETLVTTLRRYTQDATRARIGKAGADYLAQIDALLERFDFARITNRALERREALAVWLAAPAAQGLAVDLDPQLLDETRRQSYRTLSLEALRGLRDGVQAIAHLARLKTRLLTKHATQDLEATIDAIVTRLETTRPSRPRDIETRLPQAAPRRAIAGFFGSMRKLASLVRAADGYQDGGPLWEAVVRPLNAAADREATLTAEATTALRGLFDAYAAADLAGFYRKTVVPGAGLSLSKMGRLVAALNVGTADNRQKLLDGHGWSEAQLQAILDTLDARDWAFVQGVWDFLEGYWPEIAAKQQRVTGLAPEKVAATPVVTRFGTLRGGYFPLSYDDRLSARAFADRAADAATQALQGAYTAATTRRGHTKARVEGVKRPVRLDFGVLFEHVHQVIHDLTHHEALIDANRVLGSTRVQDAIYRHLGDQTYRLMQAALTDIAAGTIPAQQWHERAIAWLRQGTSIAAMGWNVTTAALQPLGFTQSLVRLGPRWLAKGVGRWLGDAARMEHTVGWIHERSPMMRHRARTQSREIAEIRSRVQPLGRLPAVQDSFFWLITRMQLVVDVPTWLGAYERALAQGEPEARAVALADQAVLDTQGGGQVKDLAAVQRGGPLMQLWTNFYSYFNVTYNLTAESVGRVRLAKSPAAVGRLAVDALLLYTVPAVLGVLIRDALRGGGDDEDLGERLVREQIAYLLGTVVLAREVSGAVQGYYGYEGPAGTRFFAEAGGLLRQAQQGEADAAFWRSLNATAGILFHYPAGQVQRTVDGFVAIQEGRAETPAVLVAGAPRR